MHHSLTTRAAQIDKVPLYRQEDPELHEQDGLTWDLSNNEVFSPPAPRTLTALQCGMTHANRYPSPYPGQLAAALSEHYAVGPRQILVGAGSAGVLQQLLLALCSPGDEVLYATPGFDAYPILIASTGAAAVAVPLTPRGHHDLPEMLKHVSPRTKVVILCSPHNPTGLRIPRDELLDSLERLPAAVTVILDEAYIEFDEEADPYDMTLLRLGRRLALLRTFSKAYGLAGLRVGYALSSSRTLCERARKAAIPFSVTRAAELAAVAALREQPALRERTAGIQAERTRLEEALRSVGVCSWPSRGNYVWLPLGQKAHVFRRCALLDGVIVREYPGEGVRITVGPEQAHAAVLTAAQRYAQAVQVSG
ncbi:aminotransferase class I/II-fold pyridoxal phosphate-dependent enzyme [Streptomyces sp. NPDC048637]|uniref:aminotransferase class I/II-fold pyridoxal phosphate-dependent enzyme n=1 Tax=Streptomyces sp. NPDC048637 TaxID=3155636 RepID=UPI003440EA08